MHLGICMSLLERMISLNIAKGNQKFGFQHVDEKIFCAPT